VTIRAIYRSYGGENLKNRPDFYSKETSLLSFLRAAEQADIDVVFLNNGPIPEERLRLMRGRGEIVTIGPTIMRRSWMAMLRLAVTWDADQVVWFAEDDYLYTPDALARFARAAEEMPDVDYFALYGSTDRNSFYGADQRKGEPKGWQSVRRTVDGHDWVRIYATTSTFGVRVGALAEDLNIVRLVMVPHRTMFRDQDLNYILQGYERHRWQDLARKALGLAPGTARQRLRRAALSPFLVASNLRSHRRPSRRRLLMAADPNFATHVEDGVISPGHDWRQLAKDTREWARARGLIGELGADAGPLDRRADATEV
jgi:hypothetical protein